MQNCTNNTCTANLWSLSLINIFVSMLISFIILVVIAGNVLVILAVVKDRRLQRQVQNWLIVSLSAADLLVGLCIMPLTLTFQVSGRWLFGSVLCELWLAADVLFVTASILNLCAISLDRYKSITDPMDYCAKRTIKFIIGVIATVWILAGAISLPPLVGWKGESQPGKCTVSKEMGYVLFSASGSFFIPVVIILGVYAKIYVFTRRRAMNKRLSDQKMILSMGKVSSRTNEEFLPGTPPIIQTPEFPNNLESSKYAKRISSKSRRFTGGPNVFCVSRENAFWLKNDQSEHEIISLENFPCEFNEPGEIWMKHGFTKYNESLAMNPVVQTFKSGPVPKNIFYLDRPNRCSGRSSKSLDNVKHISPIDIWNSKMTTVKMSTASIVGGVLHGSTATSFKRMTTSGATRGSAEPQGFATASLDARRKIRRRQERQATLVLSSILAAFLICWLPFFSIYVLGAFKCCQTSQLIFDVFFWLGYCNSALNPFIYNFANADYRRAFKKILLSKLPNLAVRSGSCL